MGGRNPRKEKARKRGKRLEKGQDWTGFLNWKQVQKRNHWKGRDLVGRSKSRKELSRNIPKETKNAEKTYRKDPHMEKLYAMEYTSLDSFCPSGHNQGEGALTKGGNPKKISPHHSIEVVNSPQEKNSLRSGGKDSRQVEN